MSQRVLISILILYCLTIITSYGQIPTINPEQTVNPATGEMGFSLPLGTVQGVNGRDGGNGRKWGRRKWGRGFQVAKC